MDDDDEPSNRSGLRATNAAAKSLCTWATARPRSASTLGYVMNGTHESTSDVMPSASMSLKRGAGLPHSRWLCCGDEVGLQLRDELGEFDHAWGRGWAGCVGGAALVLLRGKAAPSSIRWQASRPVIGPARQHYYW